MSTADSPAQQRILGFGIKELCRGRGKKATGNLIKWLQPHELTSEVPSISLQETFAIYRLRSLTAKIWTFPPGWEATAYPPLILKIRGDVFLNTACDFEASILGGDFAQRIVIPCLGFTYLNSIDNVCLQVGSIVELRGKGVLYSINLHWLIIWPPPLSTYCRAK